MKRQSRLGRVMLFWISVLGIGLTPIVSSAVCLQDSAGGIFNYNINPVPGQFAGTNLVAGVFEVPGTCSQAPLSGSIVENTSQMNFEVGISAYPNTDCLGSITMSAVIDANTLEGSGTILVVVPNQSPAGGNVTLKACDTGTTSYTSTTNAPVKNSLWDSLRRQE